MTGRNDVLEANLTALSRTDGALALRLRDAAAAPLQWVEAKGGGFTATLPCNGRPVTLASRFDPAAEAEKLTSQVDPGKHACVIVLGFGLGYHVKRLAGMIDELSVLVVHQPDVSLLRAVLERIDHSGWLGRPNVVITDDTTDRAALMNRIEKYAATLTQGTVLLTHPPSRQLYGEALGAFGKLVSEVIAYCRTSVATALVNASRTVTNLISNLPHYAAGATCNELHRAAEGVPAVCVSAGPSLAKNVRLLADPAVRRNVVVITAQTTLKLLLDHGITPDFVTALDYHEISRRFYEGLPPLPDVTLVAEPKVNAAVVDSYPGPVRMTDSGFLNTLLGRLARPRVPIRDGATVAHLSFYLAQHLGCDPIIFIGQDLGFSDGLYYCPGTAIHDVWAGELGQFNTLEMMEWQRIVRHRRHLQKVDDIDGRSIYSDEQMLTYLKQFERDFATAKQMLIDATEGGLPKAHTVRMTLAAALTEHAVKAAPRLAMPSDSLDGKAVAAAAELVAQRIGEVRELRDVARDTIPILKQMLQHQRDASRMDKLFARLAKKKQRVDELGDAFTIVNELNTVGVFNRVRADRAIAHLARSGDDAFERQRRQLDRDRTNIEWLQQAYDETLRILGAGQERLERAQAAAAPGGAGAMAETCETVASAA